MTNTCSGCDATWTGLHMAHCPAGGCHRTFTTVANFDRHRRDFACLDPATAGLVQIDGVWRMPVDEASRARLATFRRVSVAAKLGPEVPSLQRDVPNAPGPSGPVDIGHLDRGVE